MTVSNTTSRNQYTATSGQTVFPYTFEIFDKDDVAVLKNGVLLSEGTDYTVSGVGNDSGGNITLTVGAIVGDILTIYRDMAYQRLTDYQNSGDFLAQEVNDDFDRLWLAVQQNDEGNDRAIVKPITDSASIDMTLPSSANRSNKLLSFDGTGQPVAVAQSGNTAQNADSVIYQPEVSGSAATTVQGRLYELDRKTSFAARKPELIAHRGFRDLSCQNTMLAFTSALDRGADSLETDVQISSDGYPVLFHDATVDALTDGTGAVSSLSLSTLQGLSFDQLSSTPYDNERIPLFSTFLNFAKERGIYVYPEIKGYRTQADIALIVTAVVDAGMEDQCLLQSFNYSDLQYVRTLNQRIPVGLLGTASTNLPAIVDYIAELGNASLLWSYTALNANPTIANYAYSQGVDVTAWTVNDFYSATVLMKNNVNKIMSDFNVLGGLK